MPVVWVKFAAKIDAKNISTGPLPDCPVCGSDQLQRWGKIDHTSPNGGTLLRISRFRCADCGSTFSDPVKQNINQAFLETVQAVAGMTWVLGISLREAEQLFTLLELEVSRSSIWRYSKRICQRLFGPDQPFERMNIDPLYMPGVSEKMGVVVGLELTDGRQVLLGVLPEFNPKTVKKYLKDLLGNAKVEILIRGENAIQGVENAALEPCPFLIA